MENFYTYYSLNRRMGENLDWACGDGMILNCVEQLVVDLYKEDFFRCDEHRENNDELKNQLERLDNFVSDFHYKINK